MEVGAHRFLLLSGGVLLPLSAKEWAGLAGDRHAGRIDDRKDCIANRLTNNDRMQMKPVNCCASSCGWFHPILTAPLLLIPHVCFHNPIS